jgi:hypothetical protein
LELGCYIKSLEHGIFSAIDSVFGHCTVAKGKNALERASMIVDAWDSFRNPVGIGLDASRFDQHCSTEALRYEHGFYLNPFENDPELARLLSYQITNRGYGRAADGLVKYERRGCRMSGDMNTSMGNVILMCAMMHRFFKDLRVKARLINDGDDCVIIAESSDACIIEARAVSWFKDYGFTMKVESRAHCVEEIDFCQSRPVLSSRGWIMCRDPRVVLTKDLLVTRRLMSTAACAEHAAAIGQCGLSLAGDLPVLGEFYYSLCVSAGTANPAELTSGMWFLSIGLSPVHTQPSDVARVSFWRAFGITPIEQCALERCYASLRYPFNNIVVGELTDIQYTTLTQLLRAITEREH